MPLVTTPAIVLSALRYSETSKIVRLATREHGVQSAIAKGALRPRSRFGAALQVLSEGHAQLLTKEHRELHTLAAFDLVHLHLRLASDLERYATASVLAEVMVRFAPPDPHPESYDRFRDALALLEEVPAARVAALGFRVVWQLVSVLGFEPALDACVRDGAEIAEGGMAFSTREGGALCPTCAASHGAIRLPEQARADLVALLHPDAPLPSLDRRHAESHRRLLARYIRYHLAEGADLPALEFWLTPALEGRMIVGMAGHIDHGKSALVSALTGRTMDRLAEERRRGITIDLNFAPLELGAGRVAGMVDVPGHEDFVRTMVAGASGIDVALLVVAADEGIMPQTVEHLTILEHLGVPAGIPVVTKADLVDAEWLELVLLEVGERLAGSRVAFGPPLAVSVRTGLGLPELRQRLAAQTPGARPTVDLFRMPVDRAFSVAGIGTVVTGTAWSGRIGVGDAVALLPGGMPGRVRSVEMFGRAAEHTEPGARTAVGIAGVPRDAVARGQVLALAGDPWQPSSALDVELTLDTAAPKPLSHRTRVRVHLGTGEVLARVLPRTAIEPGGRGLARLALEAPVVARGGDRLVLRSYSPVGTIGGGIVLDPVPPARRSAWPDDLGASAPGERLGALLDRRPAGVPQTLLPVLLGLSPKAALATVRALAGAREAGGSWVPARVVEGLGAKALGEIRRFHRAQPGERGLPLETLRRALRAPEPVVEIALGDLARAGRIRLREGIAALAGFVPKVEGGDAEVDRIIGILEAAALSPPSLAELEAATGRRDLGPLLRLAAASGRVEAVERDRYYTRTALDRFTQTLADFGREADIVPAAIRERLGISRKYLIPLLEWADGKGLTVRVGDVRRLRVPARSS